MFTHTIKTNALHHWRAEVTVTVRRVSRSAITVDHERTPDEYAVITFGGEAAPKGVRFGTNSSAYGQIVDSLDNPAIRRVWHRWHLNDMHAGCTHQPRVADYASVMPCAWSGYRYGSSWLVEPVPTDEMLRMLDVMRAPDDTTVVSRDGIAIDAFPTPDDAWVYLHSTHSQSVDWLTTHEGYRMTTVAEYRLRALDEEEEQ